MTPRDIADAKDPDLRSSLVGLRRAAAIARREAVQTGTDIIVVRNGEIHRIDAEDLRNQTEPESTSGT